MKKWRNRAFYRNQIDDLKADNQRLKELNAGLDETLTHYYGKLDDLHNKMHDLEESRDQYKELWKSKESISKADVRDYKVYIKDQDNEIAYLKDKNDRYIKTIESQIDFIHELQNELKELRAG